MSHARRPPNVLFVICDDLGWGDLACHGNPYVRTPRLDALHDQSLRLARHRSGPLCTPARASVMTGRYAYRTRAIDTYIGRSMIDPGEVTLAAMLRDAGYATCLSGKWHLGDCYPMRPMDMGFDESLWHGSGGIGQPGNPGCYEGRSTYDNPELWHHDALVRASGYCSDVFTDHALDFIRAHRERPFFAYLAFNAPHAPLHVGEAWAGRYRDLGLPDKFARLYGMVENIDHNVGRVLDELDALRLTDDTIVVFTSDHGPCGSAKHEGQSRWNAGMRGLKGSCYEGGVRVPCIVHLPPALSPQAAGRDVMPPTHPMDWLPTLAAACGAKVPTDRAIDGMNLLPLLSGQVREDALPERTVFLQWHRGDVPVRYRNCLAVTSRWKWTQPSETQPQELYDLPADPGEARNVAADHPQVAAELRAAYERWFDDVSSTRPDNYAPPRIVLGGPADSVYLTRQDWRVIGPDSWDDTGLGRWEVRVAEAGRYRLTLQLPPADGSRTVELSVADHALQWTTAGDRIGVELDLPAGPATVAPRILHADGPATGVRQVIVEHLPDTRMASK